MRSPLIITEILKQITEKPLVVEFFLAKFELSYVNILIQVTANIKTLC